MDFDELNALCKNRRLVADRRGWCKRASEAETELDRFGPTGHEISFLGGLVQTKAITAGQHGELHADVERWHTHGGPLPYSMAINYKQA